MECDSAQPQGYGATNPIKPANAGGSFFVVRAFIIIEVGSKAHPYLCLIASLAMC